MRKHIPTRKPHRPERKHLQGIARKDRVGITGTVRTTLYPPRIQYIFIYLSYRPPFLVIFIDVLTLFFCYFYRRLSAISLRWQDTWRHVGKECNLISANVNNALNVGKGKVIKATTNSRPGMQSSQPTHSIPRKEREILAHTLHTLRGCDKW